MKWVMLGGVEGSDHFSPKGDEDMERGDEGGVASELEYLIKWKGRSHLHNTWHTGKGVCLWGVVIEMVAGEECAPIGVRGEVRVTSDSVVLVQVAGLHLWLCCRRSFPLGVLPTPLPLPLPWGCALVHYPHQVPGD